MYPTVSQIGKLENQSKAVELYKEGLGVDVIARRLQVATATVYKYLNEAGVYPNGKQKRTSTKYAIGNESKTLRDWCEQYKINSSIVRSRLSKGVPLSEALAVPVTFIKKHTS